MKPPAQGYLLALRGPKIHIEAYFFLFTILLQRKNMTEEETERLTLERLGPCDSLCPG